MPRPPHWHWTSSFAFSGDMLSYHSAIHIFIFIYIYIFHKNDIHKLNTFGAFRQISGCFAQGVLVVVGTNADRDGSGGTDWWSRNCGTGMYTHYFFFLVGVFFLCVCVCVCVASGLHRSDSTLIPRNLQPPGPIGVRQAASLLAYITLLVLWLYAEYLARR